MGYKTKEGRHRNYLKHRDKILSRQLVKNKAHQIENKAYMAEYYKTHPCVDCGEVDQVVLDSDHVRGIKKRAIGNMVSHGYSLKLLKEELAKCETRCANCHRRITHKRRQEKLSEQFVCEQ